MDHRWQSLRVNFLPYGGHTMEQTNFGGRNYMPTIKIRIQSGQNNKKSPTTQEPILDRPLLPQERL
tara:strand:- start:1245 stop:1442 length:198 start_codon:yes stop_codon:yes gene_type:complete